MGDTDVRAGVLVRSGRILVLAAAVLAVHGQAGAQLAGRPAEEWATVLDSAERLESLRVEEVVARLGLRPGDVVADLGAGTGPFVAALARAVSPGGTVYAVEVDPGFFPSIARRAAEAGVTNVRTVLGAFTDPQLPTRNVDVAFLHDVLHHIEDRATYLRTLTTYLAPGARVVVVDYHPAQSPHRDQPALQVSREQAAAWLAGAGFTAIQEVPLFTEKWFAIFRR